jgi:hypothetical protein
VVVAQPGVPLRKLRAQRRQHRLPRLQLDVVALAVVKADGFLKRAAIFELPEAR